MVWFLILVSSYLGFLLLRSRLSVLSRLALDSVHLLDGLLKAGDDDEALEELEDRTSKVLVSLLLLLALALAVVVVCMALRGRGARFRRIRVPWPPLAGGRALWRCPLGAR